MPGIQTHGRKRRTKGSVGASAVDAQVGSNTFANHVGNVRIADCFISSAKHHDSLHMLRMQPDIYAVRSLRLFQQVSRFVLCYLTPAN